MDNTYSDSDMGDYVYSVEGIDEDDNDIDQLEVVSRVVVAPSVSKRSNHWTEHESAILLENWGEKLQNNKGKYVSSEEWREVAKKVSEVSICKRTETNCRDRLDTLKKKYKREKAMVAESMGVSSTWVHFIVMDMILRPWLYPTSGHGLVNSEAHPDHASSSNEIKQMVNLNVHTDRTNLSHEMKEIENSHIHPPLTHSLVDLEKTRMDVVRDLKLERKKILKRGQVEIAKIWGIVIDDNDLPHGNRSG